MLCRYVLASIDVRWNRWFGSPNTAHSSTAEGGANKLLFVAREEKIEIGKKRYIFFAGEVCSVQCSLPAVQQVHELGETHRLAVKYCDRSTWVSR